MATKTQRATTICDALVNGIATAQQKQRALAAFGTADNFINELRAFVIGRIQQAEVQASAEPIREQVLADFPEAP